MHTSSLLGKCHKLSSSGTKLNWPTCAAAHALFYFTQAALYVVTELGAGPSKMGIDVGLWVVALEVPQLHQALLCAGLVANHLEDVGQSRLRLLQAPTQE